MSILQAATTFTPPPPGLTVPEVVLDDEFDHPTKLPRNDGVPCLIDDLYGRKVFLQDLRLSTNSMAKAFKKRWNIGNEETVGIVSPNHIDYVACVWAAQRLGALVALMSPALTETELGHQLKIAEPSLLIAHPTSLNTVINAAKKYGLALDRIVVLDASTKTNGNYLTTGMLVEEGSGLPGITFYSAGYFEVQASDKIAFLCFSSGTTGLPKAVAISHRNVICSMLQIATYNRLQSGATPRYKPGDVCTGFLPFYHIYGLMFNLHFMIYSQVTTIVTDRFDFLKFLKNVEQYRITHLAIVPPQAILLCKHPAAKVADLSSVRSCLLGAAPTSAEIIEQLLNRLPGIDLGQGYGMSETTGAVSKWPIWQKVGVFGSSGRLVPGTFAKVVKPDGTLAKIGEEGELYVKGMQICMGYYKNEQATRELFDDGWLKTGDVVRFDEDGELFILDRIKEFIKVRGFQVAPAELEGHLLAHPSIADAGVVGIPDEYSGELPLAFIVLQPTALEKARNDTNASAALKDEIFKYVADAKSRYKRLSGGIVFTDALPKSPSGKLLRRVLREQAAQLKRPAVAKL
ncbi:hypothetical protein D9613_011669 [Agrocybe pediades]|uniref:Phenylacetyl-CoA ligase n=1 Tax=Agrocybe pediades TaxID=84607 RepID=A0A8H4VQF3_9AGAR|nr:hypothetical protein D9613_011669 [Agrocybe pediades]